MLNIDIKFYTLIPISCNRIDDQEEHFSIRAICFAPLFGMDKKIYVEL